MKGVRHLLQFFLFAKRAIQLLYPGRRADDHFTGSKATLGVTMVNMELGLKLVDSRGQKRALQQNIKSADTPIRKRTVLLAL